MYYYSKNSKAKVYHTSDCGYVNRISEDNLKRSESQEKLFRKGYTFCDHCSPAGKYFRKNKGFFKHRPKRTKRYDVRLYDGDIIITSDKSEYLIVFFEGQPMKLYHLNKFEISDTESDIPGYHLQRTGNYSLSNTLKYIVQHDDYREKHPIRYSPQLCEKVRTDMLFKTIPSKYFKPSKTKSERQQRVESFHEHCNKVNPKRTGKKVRREKREKSQAMNKDNAKRVESLLAELKA